MMGKGHSSHMLGRLDFLGNQELEGGQNVHLPTDADHWQEGAGRGSVPLRSLRLFTSFPTKEAVRAPPGWASQRVMLFRGRVLGPPSFSCSLPPWTNSLCWFSF